MVPAKVEKERTLFGVEAKRAAPHLFDEIGGKGLPLLDVEVEPLVTGDHAPNHRLDVVEIVKLQSAGEDRHASLLPIVQDDLGRSSTGKPKTSSEWQ